MPEMQDTSALQEAFQRRQGGMGQPPGVPGNVPQPLGGAGAPQQGDQTMAARNQAEQSKPGERELILKTLLTILRETTPQVAKMTTPPQEDRQSPAGGSPQMGGAYGGA